MPNFTRLRRSISRPAFVLFKFCFSSQPLVASQLSYKEVTKKNDLLQKYRLLLAHISRDRRSAPMPFLSEMHYRHRCNCRGPVMTPAVADGAQRRPATDPHKRQLVSDSHSCWQQPPASLRRVLTKARAPPAPNAAANKCTRNR